MFATSRRRPFSAIAAVVALLVAALSALSAPAAPAQTSDTYKYSDAHFHLTNYAQEGTPLAEYVKMMGTSVKRSTVFGLPLQQMWDYQNSGDFAPTYYLQTDAPLYYYSFTDAFIAMSYKALPPEQQARLDPMITGFNPADMYAADHIRRVLLTFPGVFSGIGEFSIHKEFVSSKIAGGPASLNNRALDRIFDFAAEAGMVVILHNDIDVPFPKPDQEPYILLQMKELIERHPKTTVIWAHFGVGRIVRPAKDQLAIFDRALGKPQFANLYIDISWDETAKYITSSPEAVRATAALINKYPDRFLFGSDVVAPKSIDSPMAVYNAYEPLWKALTPEARRKILFENYERLFDAARVSVRAWEAANKDKPGVIPAATPASGYK
ncbi:MAG TPA: amidohydrolase family protein [Candidatus Eisenbacteria bacterium]|nr:amidohydrolase family protein [Candidatus Eisenbacteria bacterium]